MIGDNEFTELARAALYSARREMTVCAECEKGEMCGAGKPDSVFCKEFKRKEIKNARD